MILIVSSKDDPHAQRVAAELARLGADARILDLRDFPTRLALALRYSSDEIGPRHVRCHEGCDIDVHAVTALWWRRPQPFQLDAGILRPSHRTFAYNECHEAWSGLWQSLDVLWVNHPSRDEAAAHKVYQLDVARSVGLAIPNTLVTNDPAAARQFIAEQNGLGTVYKAFSATEQEWRETRILQPEEMSLLDQVRYAPLIFQEYVAAGLDLRVTIVGQEVFAAAIHSQQTSYNVDFRIDMTSARVEPYTLPSDVRDKLARLMSRLGLSYWAIDMRHTPDGRVVFLEINPAGQWLFIEDRTGQAITAALARLLASPVSMDQATRTVLPIRADSYAASTMRTFFK
jgi:glutathione synthase/RimK-type ligase-like ATP-grasp enzyme